MELLAAPDWLSAVPSWFENPIVVGSLRIVGLIVAAFLLTRLLRRLVAKVEGKVSADTTPIRALQRTQTITKVLSSAGVVVIWSLALFQTLSELGFQLGPLLAGIGIVGLAVGFGAQGLVRDVISGFFILFEDQYGVGDVIQINEVATGKVEQLTLRITGMRDLDGTLHYVANGGITHVANRSKDWARAVVDVGVPYREDPAHVREVLERVAREAKDDPELGRNLYSCPEVLGVETLGDIDITWRMIADTKPGRQFEIGRKLRERVKLTFDEEGIESPTLAPMAVAGPTPQDEA
ncbi:MAG: mechanosensitive ion channel family protein [Actinomycetota bacterium]|nr:mechanosensitive ion channel family protein [Actinomycetota bacterium]